ncbi:hypothetical protein BH10ACI3_BH10ACI3_20220 [soil metagenome]
MLFRKLLVLLLSVCFVAGLIPATAIAQRRPVAANTSPAAKFDPDTVERIEPKDKSNAFPEKGLPPPAESGGPPTDAMAARMAKEISNYDRDGLPMLITMLQRAGFFIINTQQKVLYQPTTGTGTGLAFYDFEVVGMYKLSRRGIVSSVEKMAGQIGKEAKLMPPPMVADLMLKDLRAAAVSAKPLVRFWARLIIEFGKNAEIPVDLMTAAPAQANLNIIQASLWERRLIGDVAAFAEKALAKARFAPRKSNPFSIVPASYGFVDAPCQSGNVESLILDGAATVTTTAHGFFLEQIAQTLSKAGQETMGKVATGLGAVNIALAWAKLVAAMMTLKGEIKIADPMPLVRNKDGTEGESRLMTARVWSEVGNLQMLNCVRLALNLSSGLDFNMPSDGPLSDRDISWEMTGDSSFGGQGSSKTGVYDNFVNLKAPDDAPKRDPMQQITDDNGESRMNIVGNKQYLLNKPVVPVRKKAAVKISVALKSPRDKAQNFLDIGGAALGIALGGPLGIISALPEIGFRYKWDVKRLVVPVKDWQLCTSDWAGSVHMIRHLERTYAIKTDSRTGTRKVSYTTGVEFILNPRKRDSADKIPPPKPATTHVIIDNTDIFEGIGAADVCCAKKPGKDPGARIRDAKEFHSDNLTTAFLNIDLSARLLLSIRPDSFGADAFKGTQHNSFTVSESSCPVDEDQASDETFETVGYTIIPSLQESKTGRRLAGTGEGVEELWGEDSWEDQEGATVLVRWAISRCGD